MIKYITYGICVESNIPLAEIPSSEGAEHTCTFYLTSTLPSRLDSYSWLRHWYWPDGQLFLSFAKDELNYFYYFSKIALFVVSNNGRTIQCYPEYEARQDTIQHLLLDQVLPRILSQRYKLVIHASAVVTPLGAVAFLGQSGSGKSTLAAALGQQGFPILTDDCLALAEHKDELLAYPSYPGLRLWPNTVATLSNLNLRTSTVAHYSDKQRVVLVDNSIPYCGEAVPLSKLYILDSPLLHADAASVKISRLAFSDAFIGLTSSSFRMDVTNQNLIKSSFGNLSNILKRFPVYQLNYPRVHTFLPAVRDAIFSHLNQ